ncbi:MAG: DUF969 domain-containing protein [Acidobacteria bacterium]|nr:DUF969 domain-containing protein [Acidobacteriota bacterium]MBI3421732.1 DUF969 domain-containing protein [Acidobacteriota bacterium]
MLKLIGVLIVIIGLLLHLRTTLVVAVAALATGLLAGLPLLSSEGIWQGVPLLTKAGQTGIINLLGKAFADNRLMTLFIITLPAIGLSERFGLQEQAAALIRRVSAATVGRLLFVYQLFRVVQGALGIRLNGHPSFVRPLVFPMAVGAAQQAKGELPEQALPEPVGETIKAATAASENYGNFYGQNLSVVQAGVLLVYGVMKSQGYEVSLWSLVFYTMPIVAASLLLSAVQFALLDKKLARQLKEAAEGQR